MMRAQKFASKQDNDNFNSSTAWCQGFMKCNGLCMRVKN